MWPMKWYLPRICKMYERKLLVSKVLRSDAILAYLCE